jgi:hypothetical protein
MAVPISPVPPAPPEPQPPLGLHGHGFAERLALMRSPTTSRHGVIVIERVGPSKLSPSNRCSTTDVSIRIEVETAEGPAIVSLSPDAASVLEKELSFCLRACGRH